jgi:hypothetical protein
MSLRLIASLLGGLLLLACSPASRTPAGRSSAEKPSPSPMISPAYPSSQRCPVTIPNGSTPPGAPESGVNYGNGELWVALWPEGRVIATPEYIRPDGSVDMKFGWWRGVKGQLVITGRRLDGAGPAVESEVPLGYGDQYFQASGIIFPTAGCWEINGRVRNTSLRFVTLVIKATSTPAALWELSRTCRAGWPAGCGRDRLSGRGRGRLGARLRSPVTRSGPPILEGLTLLGDVSWTAQIAPGVGPSSRPSMVARTGRTEVSSPPVNAAVMRAGSAAVLGVAPRPVGTDCSGASGGRV